MVVLPVPWAKRKRGAAVPDHPRAVPAQQREAGPAPQAADPLGDPGDPANAALAARPPHHHCRRQQLRHPRTDRRGPPPRPSDHPPAARCQPVRAGPASPARPARPALAGDVVGRQVDGNAGRRLAPARGRLVHQAGAHLQRCHRRGPPGTLVPTAFFDVPAGQRRYRNSHDTPAESRRDRLLRRLITQNLRPTDICETNSLKKRSAESRAERPTRNACATNR